MALESPRQRGNRCPVASGSRGVQCNAQRARDGVDSDCGRLRQLISPRPQRTPQGALPAATTCHGPCRYRSLLWQLWQYTASRTNRFRAVLMLIRAFPRGFESRRGRFFYSWFTPTDSYALLIRAGSRPGRAYSVAASGQTKRRSDRLPNPSRAWVPRPLHHDILAHVEARLLRVHQAARFGRFGAREQPGAG